MPPAPLMDSRPLRLAAAAARARKGPGKSVLLGYVTASQASDFVAPRPAVSFKDVNTVKDGGSARRYVLAAAAAIGIGSLMCLAVILGSYMVDVAPWAPLFAVGLYGLPVAFLLLVALVAMNIAERRRS